MPDLGLSETSVIDSLRRMNDDLATALRAAEVALSKINTPGAVSLTTHKGGDRAPYVRDVAEAAMLDARHARERWEAMRRRLIHERIEQQLDEAHRHYARDVQEEARRGR